MSKKYGKNYKLTKVKGSHVPATTYKRKGKTIHRKAYNRKPYTRHDLKKRVGRSGKRFDSLSNRVAHEYERKGYSKKKAQRIGEATAGKVFWERNGKKKGKKILKRER